MASSQQTVPVQQSVVSRSSSANSVCDTATVQTYTSNFRKIIDVLKDSPGPMKAKDIAQRTGIGQARKDVNRFLYCLQKQNILQDKGGATWSLNQQVGDEDLQVYAAQLAKSSTPKPRDNQQPVAVPPPQAGDQCHCPNAGSGCTHIHFQQNNHYHQHNIQISEYNQMQQGKDRGSSSRGPEPVPPRQDNVDAPGEMVRITPKSQPPSSSKLNAKSEIPPKPACIHDGRLLELSQEDIVILEKKCTEHIGSGTFGSVFTSKEKLDGFGMKVAVKKCSPRNSSDRAIRRETSCSRLLHPFIVPLLAIVKRSDVEIWFISPYFEKGDLLKCIEADKKAVKPEMNHVIRVKILLHISLAIQYLHTKVDNFRDVILHKDISSNNIVLDSNFNARLIDFGLAREKNDMTQTGSAKRGYENPKKGTGTELTDESLDYYAFGVVIREMLTGLTPAGCDKIYLQHMSKDKVKEYFQKSVWEGKKSGKRPEEDNLTKRAIKISDVAEECLTQTQWVVAPFTEMVVSTLKNILKDECRREEIVDYTKEEDLKCHNCKINPTANESSFIQQHAANCKKKIKVCIACERNIFLNPITCYCGAELKSSIGSRWGALLVAGNDQDSALTKALTKDVKELEKLITSKAPVIFGISQNNVWTVLPTEQTTDSGVNQEPKPLYPKIEKAMQEISQRDGLDTLIVYYSCHGKKEMGTGDARNKSLFKLASSDDCISTDEFTTKLKEMKNIKNLILVLDRCYAPLIENVGKEKFLQINACQENQAADFNRSGSVFTQIFIRGLKARSEATCPRTGHCGACENYWRSSDDFISPANLFGFIEKHMKIEESKATPQLLMVSHFKLAFFTDEAVKVEFLFNDEKVKVPLEYLQTMEQLREKLINEFDKRGSIVEIKKNTHRKDSTYEPCDTLERVMSAWNIRHPLIVSFQEGVSSS